MSNPLLIPAHRGHTTPHMITHVYTWDHENQVSTTQSLPIIYIYIYIYTYTYISSHCAPTHRAYICAGVDLSVGMSACVHVHLGHLLMIHSRVCHVFCGAQTNGVCPYAYPWHTLWHTMTHYDTLWHTMTHYDTGKGNSWARGMSVCISHTMTHCDTLWHRGRYFLVTGSRDRVQAWWTNLYKYSETHCGHKKLCNRENCGFRKRNKRYYILTGLVLPFWWVSVLCMYVCMYLCLRWVSILLCMYVETEHTSCTNIQIYAYI
jgi:hypothetical protein